MKALSINEVIALLVKLGHPTNATELATEYKLAKASPLFADMESVIESAHDLIALYNL